jgi:hypothetical protein
MVRRFNELSDEHIQVVNRMTIVIAIKLLEDKLHE